MFVVFSRAIRYFRVLLYGGLSAVLGLFVHSSVAQEDEESVNSRIEELTVTAQRTEESIQDVPIAVTALTEGMLEERQVINPSDLQLNAPNVSFTATNFGASSFSIRGVGRLVISASADSGVSTHINEIPIESNLNAIEFFDVQRVELLRGPQGTLFGRNATGGTINMVTRMPDFDGFDGFVDVELGDYDHQRVKGAINIPIGSSLAIRLAGMTLERSGYIENLAAGQENMNNPGETLPAIDDDIDGRDLSAFRGTILWEPNDNFRIWGQYSRFEEDDDRVRITNQVCKRTALPTTGCEPNQEGFDFPHIGTTTAGIFGGALGAIPRGVDGASGVVSYDYPRPNNIGLRSIHTDVEPVFIQEEDIFLLGIDIEFGDYSIGILAGTQESEYHSRQDYQMDVGFNLNSVPGVNAPADPVAGTPAVGDGGLWYTTELPIGPNNDRLDGPCAIGTTTADASAGTVGAIDPANPGPCIHPYAGTGRQFSYDQADSENEYSTAEIRFSSNYSGPFNFTLGINAFSNEASSDYYVVSNALDLVTSFASPFFGGAQLYPGYFSSQTNELESEGQAVFGEIYLDLSDNFKLTFGLRYNSDEKTVNDSGILYNSAITPAGIYRTSVAPLLGATAVPAVGTLDGDLLRLYNNEEQIAALETDLTAALTTIAGGGLTDVQQAGLIAGAWLPALTRVPVAPVPGEERILTGSPNSFEWEEYSGRVGFDWNVTPNSLLYAFFTQGYKPGGFNPPVNAAFQNTTAFDFDAEQVRSIEGGIKNTFLDGGILLNIGAFAYDYQGLQATRIVNNSSINENIDAQIFGVEVEVSFDVIPCLSVDLAYSYLNSAVDGSRSVDPINRTAGDPAWILLQDIDAGSTVATNYIARIDDLLQLTPVIEGAAALGVPTTILPQGGATVTYSNGIPVYVSRSYLENRGIYATIPLVAGARAQGLQALGLPTDSVFATSDGIPVDLDGNELPNSPEHTLRLGLTYTWQLAAAGSLALRWDYYWQSESYAREFNTRGDEIDAWAQHNVSLTYNDKSERLQVRLWVRNLADDNNVTGKYLTSDTSGFFRNYFLTEPRIYGASVRFNFGT